MTARAILAGVMQTLSGTYNATTLEALILWADSEGTPDRWNNPLATTEGWPGAYDVNSAGVKAYPSQNAGIGATVKTLRLGYYSAVVRAIRSNAGMQAIYDAINASPWCAHCQGGRYPIALYDALARQGHIPKPPQPPGPPPPPKPGSGGAINPAVQVAWDHLKWEGTTGTGQAIDKVRSAAESIGRLKR